MRAVDVITEIVIRRPIAEVAEYFANPDHATEWYVMTLKSRLRVTQSQFHGYHSHNNYKDYPFA
ncbi:MAG: hypothetical protein ABIR06_09090 [Cyclobacteriaceae bacterium]